MTKTITLNELREMLDANDPSVKLVDVLDESHYNKEHIKGAISIPLSQIELQAGPKLKGAEKIIVYCATKECPASPQAAEKLEKLGFKNIYDYEDGLKGYKETDMPLEGSLHEEAK